MRHLQKSFLTAAIAASLTVVGPRFSLAATPDEQNLSVQKLLERGALGEAVERANSETDNVESVYNAALALIKMDNNGGAEERYRRLRDAGDDSWKAIGESGIALLHGNLDAAMDTANRAVAANGDNPYAHYQLGLVAQKKSDFSRASQAFARAADLKHDFGYAHYNAALAFQKVKQIPKMADHLQAFLCVAPEAPERQTVQALLRSLR